MKKSSEAERVATRWTVFYGFAGKGGRSQHRCYFGPSAWAARIAFLSARSRSWQKTLYCLRTTSTRERCSDEAGATERSFPSTSGAIATNGVEATAAGVHGRRNAWVTGFKVCARAVRTAAVSANAFSAKYVSN